MEMNVYWLQGSTQSQRCRKDRNGREEDERENTHEVRRDSNNYRKQINQTRDNREDILVSANQKPLKHPLDDLQDDIFVSANQKPSEHPSEDLQDDIFILANQKL